LRINAEAPAELARWAARHEVPLVHFSTDYVFDGSSETPWRETDPCRPLSSYGRSKWEGEKAVQASGAPHLIIRTSWVYAAQGANFLRTMNRLVRERDELRVVADQFGAPTSAPSIAEALSAILARSASATELVKDFAAAKGLVHLTNAGSTSWHGFASAILEGLGEGTAYEGQRGSRDHNKGFSIQGRTPGQFAARSVAPAPGVRRHHSAVAAGTWARTRYPRSARLKRAHNRCRGAMQRSGWD
jgi:dTDP-4-dehydrorhamnose reductase